MGTNGQGADVFIGVARRADSRCPAFDECVTLLEKPPRTAYKQERGDHLPRCRNKVIRAGLATGAEWFFLLDDDTLFAPDTLIRLMAHQLDAVVGLTLMRRPPFQPLAMRTLTDQGAQALFLTADMHGLEKIEACTMGGLLLRRSVLERIGDPWFTFDRQPWLEPDQYAEDLTFCQKLKTAGIPLYLDLETRFQHEMTCLVAPVRHQGQWQTALLYDGPFVMFPAAHHPLMAGVR